MTFRFAPTDDIYDPKKVNSIKKKLTLTIFLNKEIDFESIKLEIFNFKLNKDSKSLI